MKYTDPKGQAQRLRDALKTAGLSGAELAERLKVTAGAVSHWLTGRRECTEDVRNRIAEILRVDEGWLAGTQDERATREATERKGRSTMSSNAGKVIKADWKFRPTFDDGGRDFGNPNVFATPADVETLVRESGQNANDAVRGSGVVQLHYELIELNRGTEAYDRFMKGFKFDQLQEHLQAASQTKSKLATRIRGGLSRLEEEGKLRLLRIDDYGTTGLVGAESGDDEPFCALVRDNLNSAKRTPVAGGSFGLGKAVLWRCSDISTVIFGTMIQDRAKVVRSRLIAKTELGYHRMDPGAFAGPGWLAKSDSFESLWDADALFRDLCIERMPGDNAHPEGTSIVIVGFRDPQAETQEDIEKILDNIGKAAAKNFWPAMKRGALSVSVASSVDGKVGRLKSIEAEKYVPPYCDLLDRHQADEVVEVLTEPGDVKRIPISLRIPATRPEVTDLSAHTEVESTSLLLVRLGEAEAAAEPFLNSVALVRGAGMVTRYWPRTGIIVGGRPFHAAVLAGTGAGSDPASIAAEEFLRLSEPPAHDRWEFNDELREKYKQGSQRRIREFEERITEALREAIKPAESGEQDEPDELKRLLDFRSSPPPKPVPATIRQPKAELSAEGVWRVEAQVHVNDRAKIWAITPLLSFDVESGSPIRMDWKSLELVDGDATRQGQAFVTGPKTRRFTFRGSSDPASYMVRPERCRARLDLRFEQASSPEGGTR